MRVRVGNGIARVRGRSANEQQVMTGRCKLSGRLAVENKATMQRKRRFDEVAKTPASDKVVLTCGSDNSLDTSNRR